ncbi:nickel ABC transporter permease [Alkalihalobacillus alcalophilus ATCC 27647 = CGMCC 1.3604]|uniref:Nickel import system permease protein NikB n=1 Tax=Alkalihalobacillus alcalophilus ATCC 27647 = CGMCC 1.3604 TaxID=1218173 RepID=J8TM92_ALKAL|nr:nickel ABC transporter permease [Alkalihalobacillus alcalophilus]AFV25701.1 dipeptide/oligopeptide transporter [Alkalihalobacillus alcalophilus ATCC 27647 = CGMCC 1.3604]KGA99063.1 nickel transporter permease NikB [Alkalihalobacillus alcalophilus ATCC 27647 = CGMCC 1.3604]MED1560708.1 ABC transporter permease [Alkalihalobacillus alcalophilus]THG88558.1 nickel ABC transporter permease [Alkalihalobacillus alcalophilus ATCC 27647 = CGMCC 1.3604]
MKYVFKKLIEMVTFLLILSVVSFIFMKLAPGDPVRVMLKTEDISISEEQLDAYRTELGFNEPILKQYLEWLSRFLQFDFGESYITKQPVKEELLSRLPSTILLASTSLLVMLIVAFPLGVLAALYRNSWVDYISRLLALVGAAIPSFWLGLIFVQVFAVKLGWFPSMGKGSWQHLVLPSLTLGLAMSSVYMRLIRANLIESLNQEFIKAAHARGLKKSKILFQYAFRHSLAPIITLLGMSLSSLLAGTVVIEVIFSYSGVGKFAIDAIAKRDYPVIQGYILLMGVLVIFINLLVDVCYRYIDPMIRVKEVRKV